ncbi:Olfactory receptor 2T6 [Heterocephalus glaber]|uniref:Olfactory receptor 2T6 n=1 Tax=Heterocephalus glaber TaxID=10181 RepID=G5C3L6_HETGA|nr:Olfactory receptor 2T6 [Heterocephalus glaber]
MPAPGLLAGAVLLPAPTPGLEKGWQEQAVAWQNTFRRLSLQLGREAVASTVTLESSALRSDLSVCSALLSRAGDGLDADHRGHLDLSLGALPLCALQCVQDGRRDPRTAGEGRSSGGDKTGAAEMPLQLQLKRSTVGGNKTLSSDFTLVGLFAHSRAAGFLFAVIGTIFLMALVANGAMIFLIHRDPLLHTPMYFLLSQLSLIDVMYISTIVPKALVDYLLGRGTISFSGCTAQYFLYMGFVGAEFFLLGLMAYDRSVAICSPLRYPVLMSRRVCWLILAGSWFGGALDSFLLTPLTMSLPFCASHTIDHFFCEAPTVLRLACGNKAAYEMVMYVCCVLMLLVPFSVVAASYTRILLTVRCMKSAEGSKKAFATCSSHMTVVTLFYGAALYTYLLPQPYHTPLQDRVSSVFYTILTPVMNPLIYSLRNRDVREAWDRLLARRRGPRCGVEGL